MGDLLDLIVFESAATTAPGPLFIGCPGVVMFRIIIVMMAFISMASAATSSALAQHKKDQKTDCQKP